MPDTTIEPTTDATERKFIPRPEEIEQELDKLNAQRVNLRAMLKISKRAYGVKDE